MNGGVAVDNSIAHTFDASTSVNHSDSWACAGGSTCALAGTVTVPVNFHFTLDGTETGSGSWNLLATYSTSIGTAFSVSIAQSGANTFSASAKLNGQAVPVTVTGGYGDSSFSVDAGVTVNYQLSTHSATMFNDSQEISLTAQPLAGDAASLNVPIFKVSLTPLDPNLIMASADGRIASPVPEPSHALLFALGAAALVATRWSRRQR
jgi:hypothetical protein